MDTITINKSELANLKLAREKAIERGDEKFLFQGKVILVSYAKYLIEYLESKIK